MVLGLSTKPAPPEKRVVRVAGSLESRNAAPSTRRSRKARYASTLTAHLGTVPPSFTGPALSQRRPSRTGRMGRGHLVCPSVTAAGVPAHRVTPALPVQCRARDQAPPRPEHPVVRAARRWTSTPLTRIALNVPEDAGPCKRLGPRPRQRQRPGPCGRSTSYTRRTCRGSKRNGATATSTRSEPVSGTPRPAARARRSSGIAGVSRSPGRPAGGPRREGTALRRWPPAGSVGPVGAPWTSGSDGEVSGERPEARHDGAQSEARALSSAAMASYGSFIGYGRGKKRAPTTRTVSAPTKATSATSKAPRAPPTDSRECLAFDAPKAVRGARKKPGMSQRS